MAAAAAGANMSMDHGCASRREGRGRSKRGSDQRDGDVGGDDDDDDDSDDGTGGQNDWATCFRLRQAMEIHGCAC
eukprot:5811686-Pyramimonas_sp.AAC.1